MASATGIPESHPHPNEAQEEGLGEDAPLLGGTGDASQQDGKPLYYNLIIGTAVISQFGIILLTILIWVDILLAPLQLFTAHPLLNSFGILLITQSILILQPTHTPTQKRTGTLTHSSLNALASASLIAGLVVIEVNKFAHAGTHFESPHAILGLTTYILLGIQATVGFAQYFVPGVFGSVERAKAVYKYHRASGYLVLVLLFVTVGAATFTPFNVNSLHIKLWAVVVTSVLVLVGVVPRIRLSKFGL